MPIVETLYADFTGGEIGAISSVEPEQDTWLLLEGFVLDSNGRLRSQWAGASWDVDDSSASS